MFIVLLLLFDDPFNGDHLVIKPNNSIKSHHLIKLIVYKQGIFLSSFIRNENSLFNLNGTVLHTGLALMTIDHGA